MDDKKPLSMSSSTGPPSEPSSQATEKAIEGSRRTVTDMSFEEFSRLTSTETVTFVIGPKRKKFRPHRDLLFYLVPHFETLFSGGPLATERLYFEEEDPATFDLLIIWLYCGESGMSPRTNGIIPYMDLYIRAEIWNVPILQNTILDVVSSFVISDGHKALEAIHDFVLDEKQSINCLPILRKYLAAHTVDLVADKNDYNRTKLQAMCSKNHLFSSDVTIRYFEIANPWSYTSRKQFDKKCYYV